VRDPVPAVLDQLVREVRAGGSRVSELDLFTEVIVGDPDDGDVDDGRVARQQVLGLLRVDADSAEMIMYVLRSVRYRYPSAST
jgi:hypothetical protein